MKTMTLKTILAGCLVALSTTALATDRHVPADYATIQTAVNAAADGDTIHIAAGVYVEQTWINRKNLTLLGEPGTILRAFPNMEPAIPGDILSRNVLFIHLSPNVVLRELSFEGDQLADQQEVGLAGVYFLDSGGAVENCRFTGFRETVAGSTIARAIRCRNDLPGAPLYSFRVVGNTIEDSYNGVQVVGAPDKLSLEITLENNIIRGVGPTENTSSELRGISLGDGVTGSITDNSISGFSYSGEGAEYPWGWGIIAVGEGWPNHRALDPIRFENNTFMENNLHLVISKGDDCHVLNNRFKGTGPGLSEAGLWFGGRDVEVRGNAFRDMPTGVIVGGEDPILGTDLGLAVDAVLADNRFCDVSTNIASQPLANATETGTMSCPFPEPELNITQAVRLSWPGYNDDYVLEHASDPNGPWSPVESALREEDGSVVGFVPADGAQKYFRLRKP